MRKYAIMSKTKAMKVRGVIVTGEKNRKEWIVQGEMAFLESRHQIISLVGGGGKTTLMYALADWYSRQGLRVLVTTTTHIRKPEHFYTESLSGLENLWKDGIYGVMGVETAGGKLKSLPMDELEACVQAADITLIEADGAKCLPCKVPIEKEPVIPDTCDLVIGVMGMDAWNQPVGERCFRSGQARAVFGYEPEMLLTTERMAEILLSDRGTRKRVADRAYHIVLNKCDTKERIQGAEKIRTLLAKADMMDVTLTCFAENDCRTTLP